MAAMSLVVCVPVVEQSPRVNGQGQRTAVPTGLVNRIVDPFAARHTPVLAELRKYRSGGGIASIAALPPLSRSVSNRYDFALSHRL